ncbi:hypothetical protein JAAARDRAFT_39201 [Jaapia argillacea MUCL 33604]|uniref:N-acetyltransferase domain-containing protein n=1 Tax=Jaapia argillacea MUCL 33604 TaxID=933084 RepID=A0A067PFH4_9AGAM|nr:hypothetical protein JAAARDRAFT_39201 [Jaapia argillacea MUCL 33604]
MEVATLHPLDLGVLEVRAALVGLLKAYLPYSLPVLGTLCHTHPHSSQSEPVKLDVPLIFACTSFDPALLYRQPSSGLEEVVSRHPDLFSVIVISPVDNNQGRFFCSADAAPDGASDAENSHVIAVMEAFLSIVRGDLKLSSDIPLKTIEREGLDPGILLGSMHIKWVPCLEKYSQRVVPCMKYICPPRSRLSFSKDISGEGLIVSEIQSSDIHAVVSTSHVARSNEYILSRAPSSVCIRTSDTSPTPGLPIAWALIHSDGSIGTLHVQPEFRRRGLARVVIEQLVEKAQSLEGLDGAGGGGAMGWNWADVIHGNGHGEGLFESLDGWEKGWVCCWVFLRFFPA